MLKIAAEKQKDRKVTGRDLCNPLVTSGWVGTFGIKLSVTGSEIVPVFSSLDLECKHRIAAKISLAPCSLFPQRPDLSLSLLWTLFL
jgi:hypothetical protein